jgi:DNA-binding NtrC family response regulator
VIGQIERAHVNGELSTASRRVLLLDDDPALQSVVVSICEKHQWAWSVVGDPRATLIPAPRSRPKVVVVGFTLSDENSLEFLQDLHAAHPKAPVAVITTDSPGDVADVVGLAGGSTKLITPAEAPKTPADLVAEILSPKRLPRHRRNGHAARLRG